jgi:hypothetical protein
MVANVLAERRDLLEAESDRRSGMGAFRANENQPGVAIDTEN